MIGNRLHILAVTLLLSMSYTDISAQGTVCGGDGGGYPVSSDGKPLSLDASIRTDTELDFSVASSLDVGKGWNTSLLGGFSGNFRTFDFNGDGYMDAPDMLRFNLSNGWTFRASDGVQVRFGAGAMQDTERGGQQGYDCNAYMDMMRDRDWNQQLPWGSYTRDRSVGGYVEASVPLASDGAGGFTVMADYTYYDRDSWAGGTEYLSGHHSAGMDIMYRNDISERHSFAAGLSGAYDSYEESFLRLLTTVTQGAGEAVATDYASAGIFGKYTFRYGKKLVASGSVRGDWYSRTGDSRPHFRVSPELEVRYSPNEMFVLHLGGGRKLGYEVPLMDNPGVFFTGKTFMGDWSSHILEDAWTYGGDMTVSLPFGASSDTYLKIGYYRTRFMQQSVVDYEYGNSVANATQIWFYALDGKRSYSDTFRIVFNVLPLERFSVKAAFRYTNAMIEMKGYEYPVEKPLTSRFRGVLDLKYATRMDKWTFGVTASVNGPSRVYSFMEDDVDEDGNLIYRNGRTPVYPVLDCRITRRLGMVELYIGGENLTGFRQKHVILGSVKDDSGVVSARQPSFDASAVWGPLMGVKIYAGVRFSLQER